MDWRRSLNKAQTQNRMTRRLLECTGAATYHFGLERRLYLLVLQAFPVDASEEGVLSDVPLSLRPAAQTFGWVLGHQLLVARETQRRSGLAFIIAFK